MERKSIAENVRFYRELRGLTQKSLGEKAYTTQKNISKIELEKSDPPLETLDRLATALNVPLPDLYCDGKYYDLPVDFTPYYKVRMKRETKEVQDVMQRALNECNQKMIVILRLTRSEMDSFKILNGDKKDAVKFWSVLDEYGVKCALDTPADYVWCLNTLDDYNGDRDKLGKAWADKMLKTWGLTFTTGLPHNVNNPWLCRKDRLHYLSLLGLISSVPS